MEPRGRVRVRVGGLGGVGAGGDGGDGGDAIVVTVVKVVRVVGRAIRDLFFWRWCVCDKGSAPDATSM